MLNMNSTSLGEKGILSIFEKLSEQINNKDDQPLQILQIQRNEINFYNNQLLDLFKNILKFGNLIFLDLSYNNLSDKGVSDMAFALKG